MAYTRVYPTRINWENEPSINTPINEVNLNKTDYALYQIDGTLASWDTTKADESDLLLCVKEITYDSDTGEFLFTWQNGTTLAVDLNIEKIPVSFSMSPQGVITMTTEDGTQYTADVGSLIKTYTFVDSTVIDFTVTTDASGNKTVTADIVDGSITGQKLQPNYLADCVSAKTDAETAEGLAEDSAEDSEAWANGTRNGVPVPNTDPAYHNNSKYWSEQSNPTSLVGLTDTDINNPTNGQTLIYNSTNQKWENQNGGSASLAGLSDVDLTTPTDGQVLTYDLTNQEWVNADIGASGGSNITVTTTEATLYGQNVTITDGVTTLTETFSPSGVALFEGVTMTGQLTIASGAFSTPLNVPYFGNYNPVLSGFTATITVTFPADSTCTCTKSGETQTAYVSPHTFYVHSAGTYTITATDGVHTKSDTVTITTDGQTESVTLTYVPDGSTVLPTDDIQTWLNCADIYDKTSYTTLSDILNDSTTLSALIADNNAVDYMVRSKSWASNKGLVPKMTSNTTPSGECIASSSYSSQYDAYIAFNEDTSTYWNSATNDSYGSAYLGYMFTEPTIVRKVRLITQSWNGGTRVSAFKLQGYNGSSWVDIGSEITGRSDGDTSYIFDNLTAYEGYRVLITNGTSSTISQAELAVPLLQFYAYDGNGITEDSTAMSYIGLNNYCSNTLLADSDWLTAICNSAYIESVLNVKNPEMTSNNTPSGIASSSGNYTNFEPWKAFNSLQSNGWYPETGTQGVLAGAWLEYEHTSNIKLFLAKVTYLYNNATANTLYFKIQHYYNSDWEDLSTQQTLVMPGSANASINVILDNSSLHASNKSRLYETQNSSSNSGNGFKVQFYGRVDV